MTALPEDLSQAVFRYFPVARLAVIAADGAPEVMPIVFAETGSFLYSPIDGKPKKSARLKRLDAITNHPRVGLVLDHFAADWTQLWWIKLSCVASIIGEVDDGFAGAESALRAKYPQYQTTPLFKGEPTMIRFEIVEQKWWGATGVDAIRDWVGANLSVT